MKFFEISYFQHFCTIIMSIVSKFERKWIQTFDFIAHSIFKGFDQKILILNQHAISKWPWLLNATTYNDELLPKCVIHVYIESKKVSRVYMHAPLQCQIKISRVIQICITPWNRVKAINEILTLPHMGGGHNNPPYFFYRK